MPQPLSFGELDFNLVTSMENPRDTQKSETPFLMLVMGDFSGRTNRCRARSDSTLADLKPILVDRDTFDTMFAQLGVQIHISIPGEKAPPVCISFSELDDFHPDALYRRLDIFQALKDTRKSLRDPSTSDSFTEALLKAPSLEEKTRLPKPEGGQASGDLLDQIIKNTQFEDQQTRPVKPSSQWDYFLHSIVKPHLVPKAHHKQEEMIDAVDAATGELMQIILHHQAFQALEAAWRGLYLLVSRLETDDQLKLFLFDVTKAELAQDLSATDNLCTTALHKLWVDPGAETFKKQPWAVVAGNYTFEKQNKDIELLGRMAKIANVAGTSFVTAAGDKFLCKNSLADTPDPDDWKPLEDQGIEENWQTLRHLPEATTIGLGLPRFLMRLPYGADTEPIDAFKFEEMPIPPVHGNYLWGNPCFSIILLLGQAFSLHSWHMQPDSVLEIDSLPLHVYKENGESHLMPCAETQLSQRAAEQMMGKGLMPILSFLNQDRVRLGRFQSIAAPLSRLAGPWQ